jgi:hypothetical protein
LRLLGGDNSKATQRMRCRGLWLLSHAKPVSIGGLWAHTTRWHRTLWLLLLLLWPNLLLGRCKAGRLHALLHTRGWCCRERCHVGGRKPALRSTVGAPPPHIALLSGTRRNRGTGRKGQLRLGYIPIKRMLRHEHDRIWCRHLRSLLSHDSQ